MAVKMRLQRKGRRKAPYYHIVVADARSPRDGKFIERLGFYNPMTKPATIEIDRDKAYDWLTKGAQPTETVNAILKFKGVLYKKHLMRGVKKGAMTLEDAETKYQAWIESKDSKVAERFEKTRQEKEEQRIAIFGKAKEIPVVEETPVAEEATEEAPVATEEAAVVEETPAVEEAPVAEETAAVEEAPVAEEAVAEETPVAEEAPAVAEAPAEETAVVEEAATPAEATEEATENSTEVEEAPVAEATEEEPTAEAESDSTEEEASKEEK